MAPIAIKPIEGRAVRLVSRGSQKPFLVLVVDGEEMRIPLTQDLYRTLRRKAETQEFNQHIADQIKWKKRS